MSRFWTAFALLAATLAVASIARADLIEIKPGDHIAIIGNTLADRMQHDGWLETLLQARFPSTSWSSATSASPATRSTSGSAPPPSARPTSG